MSGGSKIPKGWVETTLGEMCKIRNGGTPSTKNVSYWNGDIGWITPKDLSSYQRVFIQKGERCITKEGLENSSAKLLPKHTILFSSRAPIGYVVIAEKELTTNQGFKNLICDEVKSHFKYFYYLLKYKAGYIERLSSGSTFSEASTTLMNSVDIKIPSNIKEQQAIAAILTTFDDKIELLQAQNQTLEATAQTIFKEWFGKYQIGDELPEGWRVGKLGDIANHSKTSIRPFENPDTEYYHFSLPAYDEGTEPIKEKGIEIKSNKYLVESNSILVSKLNPFTPRIWTVFESQDNFICSTEFQVVKPKKEISFSLIHCLLNSRRFTNKLSQKIKGTSSSHQRVNPKDIFDVELVIPNDEDLVKFDSIVFPFIKKQDVNINQIRSLQQTRDTLLPKLMSGKLRVDEFKD